MKLCNTKNYVKRELPLPYLMMIKKTGAFIFWQTAVRNFETAKSGSERWFFIAASCNDSLQILTFRFCHFYAVLCTIFRCTILCMTNLELVFLKFEYQSEITEYISKRIVDFFPYFSLEISNRGPPCDEANIALIHYSPLLGFRFEPGPVGFFLLFGWLCMMYLIFSSTYYCIRRIQTRPQVNSICN